MRVDRSAIDAARRRLGRPIAGAWTACDAPRRLLVLDAAAGPRPCESGRGAEPADLSARLAVGELPLPHCGGCADWLADELFATAPALAAHGDAGKDGRVLVVRLAADAPTLPAALLSTLEAALPTAQALVLDTNVPVAADGPAVVLDRARQLAPNLALTLRTGSIEVLRSAAAAGLDVATIAWHAVDADPAALDAVRAAAAACGATAHVRLLLTPTSWHQLEPLARACAALRLPLEPVVLDHHGVAPLGALAAADLELAKNILVGAWPRLGGPGRAASLAEDAFDKMAAQLRALLRRALARPADDAAAASPLAMPGLAHPWCADAAMAPWWTTTLLQQGDHATVRRWLADLLAAPDVDDALRDRAWLRVLLHRDVAYRRCDTARAALRRVHGTAQARKDLARADAAFARTVDLAPFGGPWAERIGLGAAPARKPPFAVGKPRAAAKGEPRVTVLIPSYKHEAYVGDAIRSALAQRGVALRVLVVDDRSPDGTVEAARAIDDPRVEVRENARNLGLGNSTLAALATVTTPYVALLNSDDLFHPDRLARCLAALDGDAGAQLVATGMSLVDRDGGELTPAGVSDVLDGRLIHDWVHWYQRTAPTVAAAATDLFGELLERNFLVTSSNLVARTEWLRGKADELRSLKYCLDWRLFLAAAAEGALRRVDEPLLAYRLHEANTVWFDPERRWSYYLEVHRVAAEALAEAAAQPHAEVAALLRAVATHCVANTEVDGYGLLLHRLVDAARLDAAASDDPAVRALVRTLEARAKQGADAPPADERRRALAALTEEQWQADRSERRWLQGYCDALESRLAASSEERRRLELELSTRSAEATRAQGLASTRQQRIDALSQLFDALQRDLDALRATLDTVDALQRLVTDELATVRRQRDEAVQRADNEQARAATAERNHDAQLLRAERAEADRDAQRHRAETAEQAKDAQIHRAERAEGQRDDEQMRAERAERLVDAQLRRAELAEGDRDAQQARAEAAERAKDAQIARAEQAEGDRDAQRARATQAEGDRDAQRARATQAEGDRDAQRARATQAEGDRDAQRARAQALAEELGAASHRADHLAGELAAERATLVELTQKASMLENERKRLLEDLVRTDAERARLRASREWRFGNFVWNKMPLGYLSRRGKKWLRRLSDLKDRALMRMQRRAEGVAVVAACWEWPIYSHTFVYQEMIGLTHMGLDVRMFHWKLGDVGQLHKAFAYLADHRTLLQPVWESHVRDKEHFEKTKPGRLRAFLELVAQRTGRKVEELENDSLVMQGCTFARMAELAGAKYLHSYFFYDQSFMVMQAAWLLGIPRGVSCYADHMLDDYPFKLVGLQVELADVVVATSARIKRELSAKSGGKHDDKIIVKPNGVDGARFPAVERPTRAKGDRFEAISISRIEPKKGLTFLVEAVADLTRRGHDVVVHVVGSKDVHSKGSLEYAEGFERRIAELGMQERVILHGMKKQEELAPLLQRSRAFVAPYVEVENGDKDGIPTAMLEGLASGLPVVTTDSGSILEVVDAGVEGLVVKQRDAKGLADAFEKLITDPALERRMAKAARDRFDREFDIRVTERKLHERVAGLVQRVGKAK